MDFSVELKKTSELLENSISVDFTALDAWKTERYDYDSDQPNCLQTHPNASSKDATYPERSTSHHSLHGSETCKVPVLGHNVFQCSKCGRQFARQRNLLRHTQSNCSAYCSLCNLSFADVEAFRTHRASHRAMPATAAADEDPKQYVCSHCGRLFRTSTTLDSHILTHTGERPLPCRVPGCMKRFAQHSTRSFHERTHSDDMPHICAVCGRRFKHAVGVRLHMTTHTGCRPHGCADCPMVFRRACDLQRHTLVHSADKPFKCDNCHKCFRSKKTLNCHVLSVHSDSVPWHCSVCDKGFKTSGNLRVHLRVHTGEKPYVCAVCGIRFSYSSSLKTHMHVHALQ